MLYPHFLWAVITGIRDRNGFQLQHRHMGRFHHGGISVIFRGRIGQLCLDKPKHTDIGYTPTKHPSKGLIYPESVDTQYD